MNRLSKETSPYLLQHAHNPVDWYPWGEEALNKAEVVEREVMESMRIIYDYAATPEVMRLTKEFDLRILSQMFETECELKVSYKLSDKERLLEKLALLIATGKKIRHTSEAMH